MKKNSITALALIAVMAVMMLSFTACVDDQEEDNPSGDGVSHSGDGINIPDIPPGAVSEHQGEGSQTFEIDPNNPGSDSFSHSFSIDENGGSSHSFGIGKPGGD